MVEVENNNYYKLLPSAEKENPQSYLLDREENDQENDKLINDHPTGRMNNLSEEKKPDLRDVSQDAMSPKEVREVPTGSIYLKVKDEIDRKVLRKGTRAFSKNIIKMLKHSKTLTSHSLKGKQLKLIDDKAEIILQDSDMNEANNVKKKKLLNMIARLASKNKTPQGKLFNQVLVRITTICSKVIRKR